MSSIEQFVVFKEVADTGSITQASKHLFISQPSVSVQIQNLEHEYGAQLFSRTNRGVTLTVYGKILYDNVTVALHAVDQAKKSIKECAEREGKIVHIGATFTIGEYLLPHLMGLTHADDTSPKFSAKIGNTDAIVKDIADNKVNIGLIEGPIDESDEISVVPFWSDELFVIVPVTHPWAQLGEITFDELTQEKFISREKGSGTRRVTELALENSGFDLSKVKTIMELNSTQAIKEAVMAGLGVSILSILTVQEEVHFKRLAALRIKGCKLERHFNVITNDHVTLTVEENWFLSQITNREIMEKVAPKPYQFAKISSRDADADASKEGSRKKSR